MTRPLLLTAALVLAANVMPAFAADVAARQATSAASALDLSVPKDPIKYRADVSYAEDPPGTWYGDKSGRINQVADPSNAAAAGAAATVRAQQQIAARAEQCKGELHGAVAAGVGMSSHGGHSNWQGVNLNRCQTYYDDDGNAHEFGVNISIDRGSFHGGRGRGWGLPGSFGWGPGW